MFMLRQHSQYDSRLGFSFRVRLGLELVLILGLGLGLELGLILGLGVIQVLRNARGGGWVYAQALRSVTWGGGGYV